VSRGTGSGSGYVRSPLELLGNQIRATAMIARKLSYSPSLITGEHVGALAIVVKFGFRLRRGCRCAPAPTSAGILVTQWKQDGITNGPQRKNLWSSTPGPTPLPEPAPSRRSCRARLPGFHAQKLEKLGMRGSDTRRAVFENCEVPEENVW